MSHPSGFHEGANGEDGVICIGSEGVHTKTCLTGEVVGDVNMVSVYQPAIVMQLVGGRGRANRGRHLPSQPGNPVK